MFHIAFVIFFFQAEDGIRDLVRSRGLGDVYKRQVLRQREGQRLPRLPRQLPRRDRLLRLRQGRPGNGLSLIHI